MKELLHGHALCRRTLYYTYPLRFSKSQIPLIQPCRYENISKGTNIDYQRPYHQPPLNNPQPFLPLLEPSTYLYIPSNTYTHSISSPTNPPLSNPQPHISKKNPPLFNKYPSTLVWKRKEKKRKHREQSIDGAAVVVK